MKSKTIKIDEELWQKIRVLAVVEKKTMPEKMDDILRAGLKVLDKT